MPIIAEDAGYDPNRDKANMSKESNVKDGVNPLAYLVGPVVVKYGGDPSQSRAVDLGPYLREDKKTVRSITGQLFMDYGKGLCAIDAPKAQGVTGFLKKAGTVKLRRRRDPVRQRLRDRAGRGHGRQAAEKLRQDPRAGRHHGASAGLEDQAGPGRMAARAKKS